MLAVDWMGGSEMLVRVPALQERTGFVPPFFVAKAVQVVAQIPRCIREGAQPRGVPQVSPSSALPAARSDPGPIISADLFPIALEGAPNSK